MTKKWNPIVIIIIFVFVTFSFSMTLGQKSGSNQVHAHISLDICYSTDHDTIENIPLEWITNQWNLHIFNLSDNMHEPVINPRVTLESSLNLAGFYPDDPEIFTAQPEKGLYTWDFNGSNLSESEGLNIRFWKSMGSIVENPRFTMSRTVSPEILTDKTTLQKVTVVLTLEEPLSPNINHMRISIGSWQDIIHENSSLVEYQLLSQNSVHGWYSDPRLTEASWTRDMHPEVGKTYTFEAVLEVTKSNRLLGSPIFKPPVYVVYISSYQHTSKTSNSVTLIYSDSISATFTADNVVTWQGYIVDPSYGFGLNEVLSEIVGVKLPFYVKVDADVIITPKTLDLADEGMFTALIRLPKGYDASDIDLNTISCNRAPAVKGTIPGEDNTVYKAEFNIQDLVGVPVGDAVTLIITGELNDKTRFEGSTKVKIINTKLTELAEEKFEEAVAAFNSRDYELAEQLFSQAQDTYRALNNFTKVSECQGYIDRCNQYLEEEQLKADRAEALFDEGVSYFEQEQYDLARIKFEEALTLFVELGDEEKIGECEEWIISCEQELEKENGGFCMGSSLIIIIILGGSLQWSVTNFSNRR